MALPPLPSRSFPREGRVRFVPLGGLSEIGMNCLVVESAHDIFILDCGVAFPEPTFGAQIAHARFDYLRERKDRVRAIVVTHGHEDHVGAVPYLLRMVDAPVYAPAYARALLEKRLEEVAVDRDIDVYPLASGRSFGVGDDFEIEPFSVHHSIPESHGLVIRTPAGVVVHTGDFKIEAEPSRGQHFDVDVLRRAREEGVRLMLSDSTNVDVEGRSGSEKVARDALVDAALAAEGRVVIGSFASNAFRLQAAIDAAHATRRKLLLLGRSMLTHARIAEDLGHLRGLSKILVHAQRARDVAPSELLVLATGTQGEPVAALARLAKGTHPDLDLTEGDTVLLSSRIIPGKEAEVYRLLDAFERRGIHVAHRRTHPELHTSGHATRDEQREMIDHVRPEAFVPVHGTYHHLRRHAELARDAGVEETLIVENGTAFELSDDALEAVGTVPFGIVQCADGEPIPDAVLKERSMIARYGVVSVAVSADTQFRRFGPPMIKVRGLLDAASEDDRAMLRDAERHVARELKAGRGFDHAGDVEQHVSRAVRRFFDDEVGVRPLVDVLVLTS